MPVTSSTGYSSRLEGAPAAATVEIVADGGAVHGFGHLGRCLAIWEELGDGAVFSVTDPLAQSFVRARGAAIADEAAVAPRVVLLDRVAPTGREEVRELQVAGRRVALLDDRGEGRLAADLVIDPPTADGWPPAARRLSGFDHVLLRSEVRSAVPVPGAGVLLAMGGSDPAGLTPVLASTLVQRGTELTVALGPGYHGERPGAGTILSRPEDFVAALSRARLLVAGFGHSLLEAAYLGVPAVAVVVRPEHRPHAAAFCRSGTAVMVDMSDGPRAEELAETVAALVADLHRLEAMSARGRELIDGDGVERVAAALRGLA